MGFRFRKSIKIFPGVKINLSKKGFSSVSIGQPGATINIGGNGSRASVGIPGTGISYTEKILSENNGGVGERKTSISAEGHVNSSQPRKGVKLKILFFMVILIAVVTLLK